MRKFRKLITPLLALCLLFGLCACADGEEGGQPSLTLEPSRLSLTEGASATVRAVKENLTGELVWSSSAPAIATVTEGEDGEAVVTALSAGEAVITVTSEADDVSASCTVTVTAAEMPISINLPAGMLVIRAGSEATVKAFTSLPGGEGAQWTSSDQTVASVIFQGLICRVTAQAAGECELTVTLGDAAHTVHVIVEAQ